MARTKSSSQNATANQKSKVSNDRVLKRKLVAEQREWMLEQKKKAKNTKDADDISTLDEKEASDDDSGVEDVSDMHDYEKLTKKELEALCKGRGLIIKGSKKDLIEALNNCETDEKSKEALAQDEATTVGEEVNPEKETVEIDTDESKAETVDFTRLSRKELEALCQDKGLSVKGNKKDLIKTLEKASEVVEVLEENAMEVATEVSACIQENTEIVKEVVVEDESVTINTAEEEVREEESAEKTSAKSEDAEATPEPEKNYMAMTKRELEALCTKNNLSAKGNKKDLTERLIEFDSTLSTGKASGDEAAAVEVNSEITPSEDLTANDKDESEASGEVDQAAVEDSAVHNEPEPEESIENDEPASKDILENAETAPEASSLVEGDAPEISAGADNVTDQVMSTPEEVAVEDHATVNMETNDKIIPVEQDDTDFTKMTKKQLEALCKEHNLSIKGNKAELIERLQSLKKISAEAPASNSEALSDVVTEKTAVEEKEHNDSPDLAEVASEETVQNETNIETETEEVASEVSQAVEDTSVETVAGKTAEENSEEDAKITNSPDNETVENTEVVQITEETVQIPEDDVEMSDDKVDYESMTKKELEALCKEKGLLVKGNKRDLIERLQTESEMQQTAQAGDEAKTADEEPVMAKEADVPDPEVGGEIAMEVDSSDTVTESVSEVETREQIVLEHTVPEYEMDLSVKTREELEELCRSLLNRMKATSSQDSVTAKITDQSEEAALGGSADQVEEEEKEVAEADNVEVEPITHVEETAILVEESAIPSGQPAPQEEEPACQLAQEVESAIQEQLVPLVDESVLQVDEPSAKEVENAIQDEPALEVDEPAAEEAENATEDESAPQIEESASQLKESSQPEEPACEEDDATTPAEDIEVASVDKVTVPEIEAGGEDAETPTSGKFSYSLDPSTIAELVQRKEADKLTKEDLFNMFLLTAQESISNGQKIVDLEKRLEETEARIEKIEVVTSCDAVSVADTLPEVCLEDLQAASQEVAPLEAASEEAASEEAGLEKDALEEVSAEEAAEQLEVPEAQSISATVQAELPAENVVETEAEDGLAKEALDSSVDIEEKLPEEIMESPVDKPAEAIDTPEENSKDLEESVTSPIEVAEEDITTQIEQVEKTNTRVTRKRAKVKKILLVVSGFSIFV